MKYVVSAIDSPFGDTVEMSDKPETSPEGAILKWCKLSKKYPTCVTIQPETEEDGMELLKWANMHSDKLEAYMVQHKNPYKFDWIKEQITSQVARGKTSMQWNYDQLFPFCMG